MLGGLILLRTMSSGNPPSGSCHHQRALRPFAGEPSLLNWDGVFIPASVGLNANLASKHSAAVSFGWFYSEEELNSQLQGSGTDAHHPAFQVCGAAI